MLCGRLAKGCRRVYVLIGYIDPGWLRILVSFLNDIFNRSNLELLLIDLPHNLKHLPDNNIEDHSTTLTDQCLADESKPPDEFRP